MMFEELDEDGSGELTLDEINAAPPDPWPNDLRLNPGGLHPNGIQNGIQKGPKGAFVCVSFSKATVGKRWQQLRVARSKIFPTKIVAA